MLVAGRLSPLQWFILLSSNNDYVLFKIFKRKPVLMGIISCTQHLQSYVRLILQSFQDIFFSRCSLIVCWWGRGEMGSYTNIDGYTFNLVRNKHECRELNPKSIKKIVSKGRIEPATTRSQMPWHTCWAITMLCKVHLIWATFSEHIFFFPNWYDNSVM